MECFSPLFFQAVLLPAALRAITSSVGPYQSLLILASPTSLVEPYELVAVAEKLWTMVPAVEIVGGFLQTFKEYPPNQASGSLTVSQFLEAVSKGASRSGK
jgi:hypothetical protein